MMNKSSKKVTDAASEAMEGVVAASQEAFDNLMKSSTEQYEKAFGGAKTQLDEALKQYDQFTVFGKDNVDAVMAASNAYAKGFETLTSELLNLSKHSMEESIAATKALFGAKTLQEMIELQTTLARTTFDKMISQTTRVGEVATKVAQDAFEPLTNRVSHAVEKFTKLAA